MWGGGSCEAPAAARPQATSETAQNGPAARRWRPAAPRTRIIFFMLYARAMVTASGRPSGTATTTMVTA
jgi:hypothetical protein